MYLFNYQFVIKNIYILYNLYSDRYIGYRSLESETWWKIYNYKENLIPEFVESCRDSTLTLWTSITSITMCNLCSDQFSCEWRLYCKQRCHGSSGPRLCLLGGTCSTLNPSCDHSSLLVRDAVVFLDLFQGIDHPARAVVSPVPKMKITLGISVAGFTD